MSGGTEAECSVSNLFFCIVSLWQSAHWHIILGFLFLLILRMLRYVSVASRWNSLMSTTARMRFMATCLHWPSTYNVNMFAHVIALLLYTSCSIILHLLTRYTESVTRGCLFSWSIAIKMSPTNTMTRCTRTVGTRKFMRMWWTCRRNTRLIGRSQLNQNLSANIASRNFTRRRETTSRLWTWS